MQLKESKTTRHESLTYLLTTTSFTSLEFPAADWTTRSGIVALTPLGPLPYAHAMEVMAALLRHVRVEKW